MKTSKQTNYVGFDISKPDDYIRNLDSDLVSIFTVLKGRVRFGTVSDGGRGENISGEWHVFASSGTADNEFAVAHTIGAIPVGWLEVSKNKAASLYKGTTAWTSSNVYFKCNVVTTNFTVFLLK